MYLAVLNLGVVQLTVGQSVRRKLKIIPRYLIKGLSTRLSTMTSSERDCCVFVFLILFFFLIVTHLLLKFYLKYRSNGVENRLWSTAHQALVFPGNIKNSIVNVYGRLHNQSS